MEKEEGEVYREGQVFPLGIVNSKSGQAESVARNELETSPATAWNLMAHASQEQAIFRFATSKRWRCCGASAALQSSQCSCGFGASRGLVKRCSVANGVKSRTDALALWGNRDSCLMVRPRMMTGGGYRQQLKARRSRDQAPPAVLPSERTSRTASIAEATVSSRIGPPCCREVKGIAVHARKTTDFV
jgi:hypothetical protein